MQLDFALWFDCFSNSFVSAVHVSQCLGRFCSPFYSTFFIIAFFQYFSVFVHCIPRPLISFFMMLSSKEAICSLFFLFLMSNKVVLFLCLDQNFVHNMLARANEVHAQVVFLHHEY